MNFHRVGEITVPRSRDEVAWAKYLLVVFSLHSSRGTSITITGWLFKFGGGPFMARTEVGWMDYLFMIRDGWMDYDTGGNNHRGRATTGRWSRFKMPT
jgi:hypothetical protein